MYNRSYNRGRRGMTFKFKPPRRRRFKSLKSSSINKRPKAPVYKLHLAKIAVLVLIVAVVFASIVIGVNLSKPDNKREKSVYYKTSTENNNADLLRVVNKSNPLDKNYIPELVEKDGYRLSVLAEKSLDELLADAKKQGISLYVKYAYVSYDEQKKLYDAQYKMNLKKYGLSEVKAQARTNVVIPQAGRCEFQTGLMVSFRSEQKGKFKDSTASDWLGKNAKKYGFVLRYPPDKTSQTSMNWNPKSYRYVGRENAQVMQSLNMCLNEYSYYVSSRNN